MSIRQQAVALIWSGDALWTVDDSTVFVARPPPNGQVWHKAFLGGSGRRAGAHTHPAFLKMPTASSAFPLLGAPQALADIPNRPEGGKNLGEGPLTPKEISRYRDTLGQICAADNTAGRSSTRQLERYRPILISLLAVKSLSINNGEKSPFW